MVEKFIKKMLPNKLFHNFEYVISFVLILFMGVVVTSSTLELGYILYKDLTKLPGPFLGINELFEIFGLFMMVIIGLELMTSIYMYFTNKTVYIEMMFLIAITAITRKIIILDSKETDPLTLIGISAILIALVTGFYLMKNLNKRADDDLKIPNK